MRRLPFTLLAFSLLLAAGCATVMDRRFVATNAFREIDAGWWVGTPIVEALGNCGDRDRWHVRSYRTYLPLSRTGREPASGHTWEDQAELEEAACGRVVDVAEVRIALPGGGMRVCRRDTSVACGTLPYIRRYNDGYTCLVFEELGIPAGVDSIRVAFDAVVRRADRPPAVRPFAFSLGLQERTRRVLDLGP